MHPVTPRAWVVYQIFDLHNQPSGRGLCDQSEWASLQAVRSQRYVLIQDNILNEAEAERLARGTAGDTKPKVRPGVYSPR